MSRLKPKVKAFGFSRRELKGVAARIADNLMLEDEASDEDINAAVDEAIDAVIPYLEAGRAYANRVINDSKKNGNEDDDEEDGDNISSSGQSRKPGYNSDNSGDQEPPWFRTYRESMEKRFDALEGASTAETRKGRLESILKDSGTFGKQILKGFAKMKFENDEEFDEYLSDVEDDLKAYNQELADKGLGGTPPGAGNGSGAKGQPELTDAEIDSIVAGMP